MTGYQALANAIVIQAAKDYKSAVRTLRNHPESKAARAEALKLEKFFRSGWYKMLTDIDGEYLIKRLRKAVIK